MGDIPAQILMNRESSSGGMSEFCRSVAEREKTFSVCSLFLISNVFVV